MQVTKDVEYCGTSLASDAVLVAADGRLANAVVYLDIGDSAASVPDAVSHAPRAAFLTNRACAFAPRVQVASVGGALILANEDPLLHNVHLFGRRAGQRRTILNLALPANAPRVDASRAVRRAALIEIRCDAHEWMSAWMWVFAHPYYAVTDARGSFTIPDVPAGTYTVRVWHEVLGELSREIVVKSGAASAARFAFTQP